MVQDVCQHVTCSPASPVNGVLVSSENISGQLGNVLCVCLDVIVQDPEVLLIFLG